MAKNAKSAEQEFELAHLIKVQRSPDSEREYQQKNRDSLAARLRTGDRTAVEELVDLYYWQIYLYMRRLGHNHQLSEDLTQESFLNAWRHIGQLRDGKALNGWLYRIASNVSRLHWRTQGGRKEVSIEGFNVQHTGVVASDEAGHSEQLERLESVVARLPMKLKQVVVLHYMQDLTIAEAAQAAGIRQGTCKSRLNRALKILRKEFV